MRYLIIAVLTGALVSSSASAQIKPAAPASAHTAKTTPKHNKQSGAVPQPVNDQNNGGNGSCIKPSVGDEAGSVNNNPQSSTICGPRLGLPVPSTPK